MSDQERIEIQKKSQAKKVFIQTLKAYLEKFDTFDLEEIAEGYNLVTGFMPNQQEKIISMLIPVVSESKHSFDTFKNKFAPDLNQEFV